MLRAKKLTQQEIAEQLGVSRVSVSKWKRPLEAEGAKGLKARKSSGRPAKLKGEQQQDLVKVLSQGAIRAGYPTARWTLKRIQQVIQERYQVRYHPKYLNRLLRHLGWTPQVPLDLAAGIGPKPWFSRKLC